MTKTSAAKPTAQSAKREPTTKKQQVIHMLSREGGATLEDMSTRQPHSTRSFMTSLKMSLKAIRSMACVVIGLHQTVAYNGARG